MNLEFEYKARREGLTFLASTIAIGAKGTQPLGPLIFRSSRKPRRHRDYCARKSPVCKCGRESIALGPASLAGSGSALITHASRACSNSPFSSSRFRARRGKIRQQLFAVQKRCGIGRDKQLHRETVVRRSCGNLRRPAQRGKVEELTGGKNALHGKKGRKVGKSTHRRKHENGPKISSFGPAVNFHAICIPHIRITSPSSPL